MKPLIGCLNSHRFSQYRGFFITAKRQLNDYQFVRDVRGKKRIVGAAAVGSGRCQSVGKFKYAEGKVANRPSVIVYVCGPIGLLNGACWEHSNCESDDFKIARVMRLHTIKKDEELTFCYDKNEPVEISGTKRHVQCGYSGCNRIIMK